MPPPMLKDPAERELVNAIIETLLEGQVNGQHGQYPESHSDMTWAVYALLKMFKVERRPVSIRLHFDSNELGYFEECQTCRQRRGTGPPLVDKALCSYCLNNRTVIERLRQLVNT